MKTHTLRSRYFLPTLKKDAMHGQDIFDPVHLIASSNWVNLLQHLGCTPIH